jgi:hypothetical protein
MNKELLLEKVYTELNKVVEEITQANLKDEIIPTLCGWELALKWVINEIEGEDNE